MQIGALKIEGKFFLAPMAGVTDLAFRRVCREQGAALTITEMVSTRALCYADTKTPQLMHLAENEVPSAVQIFGHEPEYMARGAAIVRDTSGCDMIDINMGCPAPKIANNGDGSALMRDEALAERIVRAVKQAVDVPVTVKIRKGWDEKSINCVQFALRMQEAGADAVTVHGRTRSQQYSGKADWDAIAEVKHALHIPVIANGDVFSAQDGVDILQHTGADAAMIGRGAMGNPWLFGQCNALLAGETLPHVTLQQCLDMAERQVQLAIADKGERVALLEARRHVNYYLKTFPALKEVKAKVCAVSTWDALHALLEDVRGMSF